MLAQQHLKTSTIILSKRRIALEARPPSSIILFHSWAFDSVSPAYDKHVTRGIQFLGSDQGLLSMSLSLSLPQVSHFDLRPIEPYIIRAESSSPVVVLRNE